MVFQLKGNEEETAKKLGGRREKLFRAFTGLPPASVENPVFPGRHQLARRILDAATPDPE